jgi:HPt (histidine-containing phosphotransfer) domain-containing protein
MFNIPDKIEWIGELIPDLSSRLDQFVVDTDELDEELVEVFIEEIQRLTGELHEGLEQNNLEMIRMAAHSIKGMGGTMGLPELSVLGLDVETMAKDGRLNDIQPLVDGLVAWLPTISQEK